MDREQDIFKVMKMNQDICLDSLNDTERKEINSKANLEIDDTIKLLNGLGYKTDNITPNADNVDLNVCFEETDFELLVAEAEKLYDEIDITDLLDENELNAVYNDINRIHKEFSRKTSIINKTDLSFLAIATALQVSKALITPILAEKFDYGKSFDETKRKPHNDKTIEEEHRKANDRFQEKHRKHKNGYWQNILYQTPAYDITKGSKDIKFNMGGPNHRLYTLGHDPILGWVFGTANILTDIITLSNMKSYRVTRKPMRITKQKVSTGTMFKESIETIHDDFLNLPAALFAQYQHYKSDVFTKRGLPFPLLETFAPNFASNLYKSQYDALCLQRDLKIIGASAAVSSIMNMIISLVHGLFYNSESGINREMFEVRTRKILLISNSIASTSSVIYSVVTQNPKNLDIGGLLVTITRLFSDVRFMAKIKKEFVESEIDKQLQNELADIENMMSKYKKD